MELCSDLLNSSPGHQSHPIVLQLARAQSKNETERTAKVAIFKTPSFWQQAEHVELCSDLLQA